MGPGRDLFRRPFFEDCRRALDARGVLAMQSETPVLLRDVFLDVVRDHAGVFGGAWPYFGAVPLYGVGPWSWTYAAGAPEPPAPHAERQAWIEETSRYYNADIHQAAFALPNEMKRALGR